MVALVIQTVGGWSPEDELKAVHLWASYGVDGPPAGKRIHATRLKPMACRLLQRINQ
ncbi:MAG: hypothetical protein ACLGHS_09885 [Actinomycetes bacterium]